MTTATHNRELISMQSLKNDLLLKALRGEKVSRPPVWMMRQAGRYLPEYQELRAKYDFFTRVQTPELAAAITIQPVDIIDTDAAILFSDILVVPQAMGLTVEMIEGRGPILPDTIKNFDDVNKLETAGAAAQLDYVYNAIKVTKEQLNNRVPLIGFAGAPWTIFCYMVEGKGSKTWEKAKTLCYIQPDLAQALLQKITDVTIAYLKQQIVAGADCVQLFDSWAGAWDKQDFLTWAHPYNKQIVEAIKNDAPITLFAKGVWHSLVEMQQTGAHALGLDWANTAAFARMQTGNNITLQGNYDPAKLMQSPEKITKDVHQMINDFGVQRYIVNLGHGITPEIPVTHARAFIDAVKTWKE